MKTICIEELKRIQIEILKEVHEFCLVKGLRYSLAYGTLIGAVRHNGFIPWDDDIDILMPRPDYEILKREFIHPVLMFVDRDVDSNCYVTFGKIYNSRTIMREYTDYNCEYGVYIDIFPIDGLPNNTYEAINHYKKMSRMRKLLDFKMVKVSNTRSFLKNLVLIGGKILLFPFRRKSLQDYVIKLKKKYKYEDSNNVAELSFGTYKRILPKEVFESYILHRFEGEEFFIIKEYDKYLTSVFGDYMKLPPIEKRVTHHSFYAYWK